MYLVLSLTLMLAGINLSTACMCMPPLHPQEHFCNSDFVIRAHVMSRRDEAPYTSHYRVHVLDILKAPENSSLFHSPSEDGENMMGDGPQDYSTGTVLARNNSMELDITTASVDSLCGVVLQSYTTYMLGGRIQGDTLTVGLCSLYMLDDDRYMNKRQRAGFYRKYRNTCDCQVAKHDDLGFESDIDTCYVPSQFPHHAFKSCESRYTTCRRKNGRCRWNKNRTYDACHNDARRRYLRR